VERVVWKVADMEAEPEDMSMSMFIVGAWMGFDFGGVVGWRVGDGRF